MHGYPKEKQDSLVRRTAGGWTGSNHEWPLQGHPYDRNCGPGRQEQHATICLSSRCWHSSREAAWGSRQLEPRTWIFPRGGRGCKRSSLPHTWFHRLLFENASVLWFGQSWIGFLSTRDTKSCREVFQKVGRSGGKEGFPGGSDGKESAWNVGGPGSIPESGKPAGEGNGNPLHYFCLENPMDGGAWQVTVYGVAKSWTQLSN